MPRQIGILASALSPDLREALTLSRDLGFHGVQWPVNTASLKLPDLSGTGQRDIRALLSRNDLRLLSLTTTCGQRGFAPGADIDRLLAHLEAALKITADLACPILCVDIGPLPPAPPEAPKTKPIDPLLAGAILLPDPRSIPAAPPPAAEPRDEAFESLLHAALAEVGQLTDRFGVLIAWRTELQSLASLRAAMSSARCPFFTLDLDPVVLLGDAWDRDRALSEFAGQIGHVRLRDAIKGAAGRTQPAPIGKGQADILTLLAALDEASYSGPLVIDPTEIPDRTAEATSALKLLQTP
jgi:sugar phosphate isomerase/epimerase